jgi:uncharacterized peroxidase-related enzyme
LSPFTIHTLETAPDASRKLLLGLREQAGFIPNLAATMAESPALLDAFLGLRSLAAGSSLDAVAREVVAIAVAVETGCSYCVAAHSTFALKQGAAAETVEAVRSGAAPTEPRLQALARFARAVARRDHDVPDRGRDLIEAGFTRAQLLETLVAIAVPMLASSVFHVTEAALDGAFQPQAWAPSQEAAEDRPAAALSRR